MEAFLKKNISINQDSVSLYVKKIRMSNNYSLEEVSLKTGVSLKYLVAIESADYRSLPRGVYSKIFFKKYIEFLGIRHKNIVNDFLAELNRGHNPEKNIFFNKVASWKSFISLPKILKNIIIFILIAICFFYLYFYLKNIFAPPFLEVFNIQNNKIIKENSVLIEGRADRKSDILINNQSVILNENGYFSHLVYLNTGTNFVTISAQKKYSEKNILTKQLFVEN